MWQRRLLKPTLLAFGLSVALYSNSARAAYVVNAGETGGNVVFTGSGSLNLGALQLIYALVPGLGFVVPNGSSITLTPGSDFASFGVYVVPSITGPVNFGTGGPFRISSGSGNALGVSGVSGAGQIEVPTGYVSGSDLGTTTSIVDSASFASLGMKPGTYVWSWGSGDNADSFTLNIGGNMDDAVPEPSTWAMMIAGFGAVGGVLRRGKRSRTVTA